MKRSFSGLRKAVALIDAAKKNDAQKVKSLLEKGADPNATLDKAKITPLHFAVQSNALDVVPLLLAAGASLDNKTEEEETPLDILKLNNQPEMLALLNRFVSNQTE